MKEKLKHIALGWLRVIGEMILGWLTYVPIYCFFALGVWVSMKLTGLYPLTFIQALGLVVLIRYAKNTWKMGGDRHIMSDFKFKKEPYQVPPSELRNGLCAYGDRLMVKTVGGIYDVKTGEFFDARDKQFSPTLLQLQ